jgi:2-alkyl-3-oxoalkanoate reductase
MQVFVTGATGVIGRRLVPLLIRQGHWVTAQGRTPEKRARLERAGARAVNVDLFDPDHLQSVLAGQQVVINLATHIPASSRMFMPGAWRETDRLRRAASANLVQAAQAGGATRFIQESFGLIYPDRGDDWIEEDTPPQPGRYNRSVLAAEAAAQSFNSSQAVAVVLRFGAFYGADSPQTRDMIRLVRSGWAPLPGSARAYLSSVSHDDAAAAVAAALSLRPGIYNVVDDEPLRRQEFFFSLANALGVRLPRLLPGWSRVFMGSLGETLARSLRLSNRKLRGESDWKPRYPSAREGWPAVVADLGLAKLEAGGQ